MRKAHSRTSLFHRKTEQSRRKPQMSFVLKACVDLFPTWSLTQLPTHFLEFYWFRMLSWICNFLATNGKGYDNARLSDDIHRGSRQIVTLYLSLIYRITKWTSMKTSIKPLQKIFKPVLYKVVIEISTALHRVCICICKYQTHTKSMSKIT